MDGYLANISSTAAAQEWKATGTMTFLSEEESRSIRTRQKREERLQRNCISRMKDAAKGGNLSISTTYTNYLRVIHESHPLASAALLSDSSLLVMLNGHG